MTYFNIGDINAGVERITELDGEVHIGPTEVPDTGYWALATDPAGAHFYILQPCSVDPWQEF